MSSIFDPKELTALMSKSGIQKIEDKLDNRRMQGIKNAFEQVKGDYDVHDTLADIFGEAEGFVLRFSSGTYVGDFERDSDGHHIGEEPTYLSFEKNTPQYCDLLLIAQRNRNNYLALGDWYPTIRGGGKSQSIVQIFEPDVNSQKILSSIGAESLIEPENFALNLIAENGEVEFSVKDKQNLPKNREFKQRYGGYSSRMRFTSKLEGNDLIELYKDTVRDAVRWASKLESLSRYSSDSVGAANFQNAKFFNRDRYSATGVTTKIYNFELKQMNI